MLRVLKLYVVVNDKNIYELNEQQRIVIENEKLPVIIIAKNGFHFSKPYIVEKTKATILLIGIGCKVDNGKLIGCALLSVWLFIIYFAIHNYIILVLANLPVLYVMYYFFWKPAAFLNISLLNRK